MYCYVSPKIKTVSLLVILYTLVFGANSARSELVGSVEAKGLSFISSDYENTKASNFGLFGASIKSIQSEDDIFKINLSGMYAVGTPVLSYLNLREIYFTIESDSNSKIHIGRKINIWSNVDDRWNLGFFQPQFRWNSLNPENQGLTGLFFENRISEIDFLLYTSGFFIPDQGPGYELKDGQFESNNPWFQSPPRNILFQNQLLPIDYKIEEPKINDVVFQSSFGLQLKYGFKKGFFANFAAIYKPSHQISLGYKGVIVTDRVKITILPKTYYENIIAADIGYKHDWGMVDLSVLYLRPTNADFTNDFNQPIVSENTSFGPHIKLIANESLSFDINVLLTTGQDIVEIGPEAKPDRVLSSKFTYRNAHELSATYQQIFNNKFKLSSQLIWRQAEKNNFQIIKSKNTIDLKGPWKFLFDLILVETSDETTSISNYRNLDQLWIGASYDF